MIYPTCTGNIKSVKCKKESRYYRRITTFRRLHHYMTIKWAPKSTIKGVSIAYIRSQQNILHNIRVPVIKLRKQTAGREGIGK
jgi:hypothetical protein